MAARKGSHLLLAAAQPVDFEVSAGEVEAAWTRAQEWLALFARTPLSLVTNAVIQTELLQGLDEKSYTVAKIKSASGFRIIINYKFSDTASARFAEAVVEALVHEDVEPGEPSISIGSGDDVSKLLARYMS